MSWPAQAVLLNVGLQMVGLQQGRLSALCMRRHGVGNWSKIRKDKEFEVLADRLSGTMQVRHTYL